MKNKFSIKVGIFIMVLFLVIFGANQVLAEDYEDDLWFTLEDTATTITYEGDWYLQEQPDAFMGTEMISEDEDAYAELTFEGSAIRWIGSKGIVRGLADVYINDELIEEGLDASSDEDIEVGEVLFEKHLEPGTHTLRIVPRDEMGMMSIVANLISIEAIEYIPTIDQIINDTERILEEAQVGKPGINDEVHTFFSEEAYQQLENLYNELTSNYENEETISKLNQAINNFRDRRYNAYFPDLSSNRAHAEVLNTMVFKEGIEDLGKAIDLQNNQMLVSPAPNELVPGSDSFTIEFWFKTDPGEEWWNLPFEWPHGDRIYVGHNVGDGWNFMILSDGERTDTYSYDDSEDVEDVERPGNIADYTDRWLFVQSVVDRAEQTQTIRVYDYENDVWYENYVIPHEGETRPTGAIYLGSAAFPADGLLNEMRFWHEARTQADAEEDMFENLTGEEDGLVGYWNFNEVYTWDELEDF